MDKHLHIISFDVPFPPNYGGVIDVYYKIKKLNELGYKILLHTYEYGRGKSTDELLNHCEKVYYYNRNNIMLSNISSKPYIIKSRENSVLIKRLKADNYKILCEGMHTSFILNSDIDKSRITIRTSNIEHEYYYHLYKNEKSFFKSLFFLVESKRLKKYEKLFRKARKLINVSKTDNDYFKQMYPYASSFLIHSFHSEDNIEVSEGQGTYCLFNGNLAVSENEKSALFLINVWEKYNPDIELVISGLNPSGSLKSKIEDINNVSLKANLSLVELNKLIRNAHINLLYTPQATGLKLKLIKALFNSRFIIANDKMLQGSGVNKDYLTIANTEKEYAIAVNELKNKVFDKSKIENRKQLTEAFNTTKNAEMLISIIFGS